MQRPLNRRLIFLLFLMFFYILAQLGWWAFLITRLTRQVHADDPRLEHRIGMVWGEGLVFALLLLIGFIFTYRSYLKELALARLQRNFLLSVSHEFKTPIAALRLQLETLLLRKMDEDRQRQMLERAIRDVDRLNALSGNILAAARIEQNAFPVHRHSADLSAFMVSICEHCRDTVGKNHITTLAIEKGIQFSFDGDAMNSILVNLYENAVKYAPEQSVIHISLSRNASGIRLCIDDEGKGIDASERQKVFDRFFRSGDEETRTAKGAGLGLYIVKHFVSAHKGKIYCEDSPKGGARFVINFQPEN